MHIGTYAGGFYPLSTPATPGGSRSSGGTLVPEPGMLASFGLALAALVLGRRRTEIAR